MTAIESSLELTELVDFGAEVECNSTDCQHPARFLVLVECTGCDVRSMKACTPCTDELSELITDSPYGIGHRPCGMKRILVKEIRSL